MVPPEGVHFGIVPTVDIVGSAEPVNADDQNLLDVAAQDNLGYAEYVEARTLTDAQNPGNLQLALQPVALLEPVVVPQRRPDAKPAALPLAKPAALAPAAVGVARAPERARAHAELSEDEKVANAAKSKGRQSTSDFLETREQSATTPWSEDEDSMFTLLNVRYRKGESYDYAQLAKKWNEVRRCRKAI